jgi:hypothetical protein
MATKFGNKPAAPIGAQKGRFAGVDLTLGLGKPLLPDGTHVLEVGETKRSTQRGDTFFAEVKIVESEAENVREGSVYQWMRSLKDSYGYGVADVCRFAIACGDLDEEGTATLLSEVETGISVVDAACGVETAYGEQPLRGCKVRVHVTREGVKPSKDGKIYPDCTFEPYRE